MQGGGFTKDISYLKGLLQLKEHLEEGGELAPAAHRKICPGTYPIINELRDRQSTKTCKSHPADI